MVRALVCPLRRVPDLIGVRFDGGFPGEDTEVKLSCGEIFEEDGPF